MKIDKNDSDIIDKLCVVLAPLQFFKNHLLDLFFNIFRDCTDLLIKQFLGEVLNVDTVEVGYSLNLLKAFIFDTCFPF